MSNEKKAQRHGGPASPRLFSALFAIAKLVLVHYLAPNKRRAGRKKPDISAQMRVIMDDSVQKSCWGVAAKAVVGFAFIILVAWLIAGVETAQVAVAG